MINLTNFKEEVYAVIAAIPRGKVITYGQIAWLIGMPRHARLVGRMLQNSQGRTAPHWQEQTSLLQAEGVIFRKNGCVDMKACGWKFNDLYTPLSTEIEK